MAISPRPRVLVIRGGAIGDFILTLPAIQLLREQIPDAHLEILGYQPIIELARAAGLADATRHLEHVSMAPLFVPNANLDERLQDYFRSFNLIVSYLYDPDSILRGNMERIGVKTFLEASHQIEPDQGHAAEQLARPLERLAMFLVDPAPRLCIPPVVPAGDKPVFVLHPGSGSIKKNWPVENWSRLLREMGAELSRFRMALVTGEAEAERGITSALLEGWRGLEFVHWDQLPLVELAARLAGSAVFVGHDSGVSHLAAACGLPCLLLFGPTDPAIWAPRNVGVHVLAAPSGDLKELQSEMVRARLREFLAEKISGPPL